MTFSRRHLLAGAGVLALAPLRAKATNDADVRHALDEAAALPPDRALALLQPLPARSGSVGSDLDLQAARAGLRIDLALEHAPSTESQRFDLQVQRITGNDAELTRVERDLHAAHRALLARATAAFDRLALPGTTVGARFERLWRDPRYLFPDDADGRAAAVDAMRATLAAIQPRLPRLVGALPPECSQVEIRALTAEEIAAGKGGYRILPGAGTPGAYVVDLKEIRRRPSFSLPSVVAHELLPGHMAQLPQEANADPHPLRLRYAAAFTEGWGSYAEMLMAEDGLFADPHALLGHLHWMLFRICRGLADIALHVRGARLDQALAAMRAAMGEPVYFAPFAADLARIAKEPAVRAAEAWLPLRLRALRPRDRRDWPRYHAALLQTGRRRTEQCR
ncbi:DUF885 family protein [Sphingomonas sp. ABOLD]|uniref:Uncharacterized protein (DUF885 family) n=1 Tax=Sphingomonas trueperi TaxID=53317 RepID=A0A7X5Y076_9SPHN|nr:MULTISPECIES: DUF885 family protein [Sphingomonas]NJB98647.1 uncharacterized protein (DUF885 family) [Sphingomonas trueperi]RSV36707.1 DUF885 family protein [Sphingomonas sp. ABOLE]RSV47183.1 DUF885 family protein [Sphingomonas sp. ABOLD]